MQALPVVMAAGHVVIAHHTMGFALQQPGEQVKVATLNCSCGQGASFSQLVDVCIAAV